MIKEQTHFKCAPIHKGHANNLNKQKAAHLSNIKVSINASNDLPSEMHSPFEHQQPTFP